MSLPRITSTDCYMCSRDYGDETAWPRRCLICHGTLGSDHTSDHPHTSVPDKSLCPGYVDVEDELARFPEYLPELLQLEVDLR